jgi:hypothetical protein
MVFSVISVFSVVQTFLPQVGLSELGSVFAGSGADNLQLARKQFQSQG